MTEVNYIILMINGTNDDAQLKHWHMAFKTRGMVVTKFKERANTAHKIQTTSRHHHRSFPKRDTVNKYRRIYLKRLLKCPYLRPHARNFTLNMTSVYFWIFMCAGGQEEKYVLHSKLFSVKWFWLYNETSKVRVIWLTSALSAVAWRQMACGNVMRMNTPLRLASCTGTSHVIISIWHVLTSEPNWAGNKFVQNIPSYPRPGYVWTVLCSLDHSRLKAIQGLIDLTGRRRFSSSGKLARDRPISHLLCFQAIIKMWWERNGYKALPMGSGEYRNYNPCLKIRHDSTFIKKTQKGTRTFVLIRARLKFTKWQVSSTAQMSRISRP